MIPPGKIVVDASVVAKWYLPEAGSDQASLLLDRKNSMIAPDLIVPEFGNIIWKKVRRAELTRAEADAIIDSFVSADAIELRPANLFLRPAFDIAVQWKRTVCDSLYLAVALAEACPFITADRGFAQGLRGTPLGESVLLLGED